jgi:hypothetical protein
MLAIGLSACSASVGNSGDSSAEIQALKAELKKVNDEKALVEKRLAEFDKLDFDYYSGQQWDKFKLSHADNIKVYYPDGTTTEGLNPQHIDMLKPMFAFAPDTKIKTHPVRFGSGEWTAVIGEMEGTFSQPMPVGEGKTIPPTNKKFKLAMVTIGRWNGDKMTEEYLFWDNQTFMKQIGVAN